MMNPDWQYYAATLGGAILGSSLALKKNADPEKRVLRQWLFWTLVLSGLIFGTSAILAFSSSDSFREPWGSRSALKLLFGFGLILQVVLTLSGIILGSTVLYILARRARNDLK